MSVYFSAVNPNLECANVECPNTSNQGMFQRIQVGEGKVVGGDRAFIFYLCLPCAKVLRAEVVPNE